MKPFLSVIIPAYNEARRLPLTLLDIDRHLSAAEYSSEVIVVVDGATDATQEIAERFSHLVKNMKVIAHTINQGKGAAVRTGMLAAKGNWRLFTDADNSTSVDQFGKMLPLLKEGYDVVMGSRGLPESISEPPQHFLKRSAGRVGNFLIQRLVLRGMHDTQCGFKCFSEAAALAVFHKARLNGWGFDVEALALAERLGYRIKEMPVRWVNNLLSQVRFTSYFTTLWEVVKVRRWLHKNVYGI